MLICTFLDIEKQLVTIESRDISDDKEDGVTLNRLDFKVGETKSFEYKGKIHKITFDRVDKAGRNKFSKQFNGKAAFFKYEIINK